MTWAELAIALMIAATSAAVATAVFVDFPRHYRQQRALSLLQLRVELLALVHRHGLTYADERVQAITDAAIPKPEIRTTVGRTLPAVLYSLNSRLAEGPLHPPTPEAQAAAQARARLASPDASAAALELELATLFSRARETNAEWVVGPLKHAVEKLGLHRISRHGEGGDKPHDLSSDLRTLVSQV